MNKYSVLLVPVAMIFFFSYQQKKKHIPVPVGTSKWTGTMTYEEVITASNPAYNGKTEIHANASFTDALPTLYRDDETTDLNFTDDKGPGHHKVHSEITDVTGKKCIGDCESNNHAELHSVVINEEDNVYDIEVIFPTCVGTGNCVENGIFKVNDFSATVSDHPLGNKDVLSGTETVTGELPASYGTFTRTITWHLVRSKPVDAELIVTPVNYDNWLPEPGRNELSKGSVMTINLKLQGKNGKPLNVKAESFELHLSNTSREPGITINYPVTPDAKQLPDLRFLMHPGIESIDEDQFISVGSPDGTTGKAMIASYDGGGYTTLTVEAILKDKSRVQGRLLVSTGETEILIPKRDPNSIIAEKWLKENGNPGDKDDKEEKNGNINKGDGLTAYEEYRGVISENKFKRLDPQKKELGVLMKKAEFPIFSAGVSLFESATTVTAIRFYETEIGTDRRLNKNALSAHDYDQYVEKLENGKLEEGTVGENQPTNVIAKLPQQAEHVVIDITQINQQYQSQAAAARRGGVPMPFTAAEDVANTVAHELAHGINVNHHGLPFEMPSITVPLHSVDIYHVFLSDGSEDRARPFPISGGIGKAGNDESGDLSCIMAYTSQYQWVFTVGADASLNYYAVPLMAVGKKMCDAKTGTGVNANNKYFGDATFGNCMSQIKLR